MLNDLSRFTRLATFLQSLGGGLLAGLPFALFVIDVEEFAVSAGVVLTLAVVSFVTWFVYFTATVRRGNTRLLDVAAATAAEIGSGRLDPGPSVPARLLRTRPDRKGRLTAVLGVPPSPVRADLVAVLTVLPNGAPPRRVAVLAPATLAGALTKNSHHAVALDPTQPETGVLDGRLTGPDRDRLARDPRWTSESLPTDRTVVGGYLPLVGIGVLGVALGIAVSVALSALLGLN